MAKMGERQTQDRGPSTLSRRKFSYGSRHVHQPDFHRCRADFHGNLHLESFSEGMEVIVMVQLLGEISLVARGGSKFGESQLDD
jgi:hypothetical protein